MKVYYEFGKDNKALINRKRFLNKLGLSEKNVIGVKSVNGDNIEIVTKEDRGNFIHNTDGLITNDKNVYLSITIADCLPIVIFDPQKEVISLIHSGWKGLEKKRFFLTRLSLRLCSSGSPSRWWWSPTGWIPS